MESNEYFEKVMQDYNQNRKGRSLRCDYVRHFEDGTDAEVTKTSQASLDSLILENQNFIQKYWYG